MPSSIVGKSLADAHVCHLRDYAETSMEVGLRSDNAGEDSRLFREDRGGSFVTRGFEAEEVQESSWSSMLFGGQGLLLRLGGLRCGPLDVFPPLALPEERQRVVMDDLANQCLGVAAALHLLNELRHR